MPHKQRIDVEQSLLPRKRSLSLDAGLSRLLSPTPDLVSKENLVASARSSQSDSESSLENRSEPLSDNDDTTPNTSPTLTPPLKVTTSVQTKTLIEPSESSLLPALFAAILQNDADAVLDLHRRGVDLQTEYNGELPLFYAIRLGRREIVSRLLELDESLFTQVDAHGRSGFQAAFELRELDILYNIFVAELYETDRDTFDVVMKHLRTIFVLDKVIAFDDEKAAIEEEETRLANNRKLAEEKVKADALANERRYEAELRDRKEREKRMDKWVDEQPNIEDEEYFSSTSRLDETCIELFGLPKRDETIKETNTATLETASESSLDDQVLDDEEIHVAPDSPRATQAISSIEVNPTVPIATKKQLSFPLHEAVVNNDVLAAAKLIQQGAKINSADENFEKPLHLAIRQKNIKMVRLLLKHGANPNSRNHQLESALHLAVASNSVEIIEAVILNGALINARDEHGRTALFLAAENRNLEMMEYLLRYGCDVNIANREGIDPLFMLTSRLIADKVNVLYMSDTRLEAYFPNFSNDLKMVGMLLQNGVELSPKCKIILDLNPEETINRVRDLITARGLSDPKQKRNVDDSVICEIKDIINDQAYMESKSHYSIINSIPKTAENLQRLFAKHKGTNDADLKKALAAEANKRAARAKNNPFFSFFGFRDPITTKLISVCQELGSDKPHKNLSQLLEIREDYQAFKRRRASL